MLKRVISTIVVLAMMLTIMSVNNVKADQEDGDICENPWSDYFTTETEPGDLELPTVDTDNNTVTKEESTTSSGNVAAPKTTKVKKAKKKLNTKRVSIKIKKVKDAVGYQLKFSKTKKFKKVLAKRIVKKAKITVKAKKLKNKKKLFVKVRAYKLDSNIKVWGEWSKAKKVKIK